MNHSLRGATMLMGVVCLALMVPYSTYFWGRADGHRDTVAWQRLYFEVTAETTPEPETTQDAMRIVQASVGHVEDTPEGAVIVVRGDTLTGYPHPVKIKAMEAGIDPLEVIWLARCLISETDEPSEMPYVAWAVRNRVETRYQGVRTYRQAILKPYQFSAFNRGGGGAYRRITWSSRHRLFDQAVATALDVMTSPATARPFPRNTRHYYSPISMVPVGAKPRWIRDVTRGTARRIALPVAQHRFQFFAGVY